MENNKTKLVENENTVKEYGITSEPQEVNEGGKKKKSFPTAFTVLFIVLIFATLLTWIVPAGKFKTLSYDKEANVFNITDKNDAVETVPADQKILEKYKITASLDKFQNGDIKKPIAIPGTYERIPNKPQNFFSFITAPVQGIIESIDIIVFVLILGGVIGLINATGAFDAGIAALSSAIKGNEFLLIVIIFILVALGGTTFGFAEETIALYPILMPVFLATGYDAMTCLATIYMASSIGTMYSTVNPFSVVIASTAAGINFKTGMIFRVISLVLGSIITLLYIYNYTRKVKQDPNKSLVKEEMPSIKERFLNKKSELTDNTFTIGKKLTLLLFALGFIVMIYGVINLEWWFTEMTSLFLFVAIVLMFLSGLGENKAVNAFLNGASDLVSVALIIGIARAINIVMEKGSISDTLLNTTANAVTGMNGGLFVALLFVLFSVLGLFIPSSSGLATLSMPIVAPLADAVKMGRDVVVSAYNYGQGWMSFITPTGLILATCEMAGITFNKWLKFIMPLMGIMGVFSIIMLVIQSMFA